MSKIVIVTDAPSDLVRLADEAQCKFRMPCRGKSLAAISEQINDAALNSRRTLVKVNDHMVHDELVCWARRAPSARNTRPLARRDPSALPRADLRVYPGRRLLRTLKPVCASPHGQH